MKIYVHVQFPFLVVEGKCLIFLGDNKYIFFKNCRWITAKIVILLFT